jgi:tetratricopeptide (TPR) repeat protein
VRFGWRVFPLVVGLLFAQGALAQTAPLDPATEARRTSLFEAGRELHLQGKHAEAVEKLKEVVGIRKSPQAYRALGLAESAAGKLVDARAHFEQALRMAKETGPPAEVAPAKTALAELLPRLPRLRLVLPAGMTSASVRVDDVAVTLTDGTIEVDPGTHTITAGVADKSQFHKTVEVAERAVVEVKVELAPLPLATSVRGPLGIGLMATGGAGLAAGVVTGILALGAHDELAKKCPQIECASNQRALLDEYHALGATATVSFIAGGVLAAAGAVLFITAPHPEKRAAIRVTPYLGFGAAGARVEF